MAQSTASTNNYNGIPRFDVAVFDRLCIIFVSYRGVNSWAVEYSTAYLVSGQSSTENRSDDNRVDIIGQQSKIASVQGDIFLKASIFMVQVIRALNTMLLLPG